LNTALQDTFKSNYDVYRSAADQATTRAIPDWIIHIKGIEHTDALDPASANSRSRSIHSSTGFMYGPSRMMQGYTRVEPALAGRIIGGLKMAGVRRLGRCSFQLVCDSEQVRDQMNALFPSYGGQEGAAPNAVAIYEMDVRGIVNTALRYHDGCLWIDAAALIAPNGKKILMAGASHSGKSTCAVALALKKKWRVLAEDITLFDMTSDELLCFASPFSLKPGTADRLSAHGCQPPPLMFNEWIPMSDMAVGTEVPANLDFAFIFDHIDDTGNPGPLVLKDLRQSDFVRGLVGISNLLHTSQAADKLCGYLENCRCIALSGGTISERLDEISKLVVGANG
jgi:hypothetical protein